MIYVLIINIKIKYLKKIRKNKNYVHQIYRGNGKIKLSN